MSTDMEDSVSFNQFKEIEEIVDELVEEVQQLERNSANSTVGITNASDHIEDSSTYDEKLPNSIQSSTDYNCTIVDTYSPNLFDWRNEMEELDKKELLERIEKLPEKQLIAILGDIEECNSRLLMEIDIYEYILNEDETVKNTLEMIEMDQQPSALQESYATLSYSEKCFFANKKLQKMEEEFEAKKAGLENEVENLRFKLESLNLALKDLLDEKEKFDTNIRFGGRHPVTKKIILQKVLKHFDDSIRTKMEITNKYKVQIQHDSIERKRLLNQAIAKQKQLEALNTTKFQEAEFAHQSSSLNLKKVKSQLATCKSKLTPLIRSMGELKKELESEKLAMEEMKHEVLKQERLKEIMLTEKARNDQRMAELEVAMRKIRLDPRRHNLPQVVDYAAVKRENAALQRTIKKWHRKVEIAEQAKVLYLSAVQKKQS